MVNHVQLFWLLRNQDYSRYGECYNIFKMMKLCVGFFKFQSENTIRLSLTLYQCTRIFRLFPEAMDSGVRHATKRKTTDSIPRPCLALNALFRYICHEKYNCLALN